MIRSLILDFDDTIAESFTLRLAAIQKAVQTHLRIEVSRERVIEVSQRYSNIEEIMEEIAPRNWMADRMARSFREEIYGDDQIPLRLFPGVKSTLTALF